MVTLLLQEFDKKPKIKKGNKSVLAKKTNTYKKQEEEIIIDQEKSKKKEDEFKDENVKNKLD
jgi:hypothetical protein